MKPGIQKFLQFLCSLEIEPNMIDLTIDGPALGDREHNGFIDIQITLDAAAMDKLVASGLVKEKEKDQWGIKYAVVEDA